VKHQSRHELSVESGKPKAAQGRRDEPKENPRVVGGAAVQYAALPYRSDDGLEVLLITSRDTGRWVLPKGWPMKNRKAHAAAAREAFEEARVRGKIAKRAIGRYSYGKRLSNGAVNPCTVEVYPLAVERQMNRWPEKGQRTLSWFSPEEAAARVDEAELAGLIESFARTMSA
jgi:8-oxo-dGTP pyrophosphatase MutT (NUDIX family)